MALLALLMDGAGMGAWETAAPQEVVLESGRRSRPIRSRLRNEKRLLSLRDLSRSLNLRQREDGSQVRLEGPRGWLALADGRSVVSSQGPDILLSAPVWRRRKNDWYVPEDFLVRALPQILDAALKRSSPHHYRLEQVRENRVVIRLNNYPPDRVRIVFQPQRNAPIRISELPSFLLVEFGEHRVVPQSPDKQPDTRIVASLDFNPHHVFGSFRILKGERFDRFEGFQLQAPFRQVIDVYGAQPVGKDETDAAPANVATPSSPAPPEPDLANSSPLPARGGRAFADASPLPDRRSARPVIALDPGHGGLDGGQVLAVESPQELSEKAFALQIAERIRRRLSSTPLEAVLIRTRDVDLNLEQRSAIANYYQPQAFVSLHLGNSQDAEVSGPVVYVHSPRTENSPPLSSPTRQGGIADRKLRLLLWDEGQQPHLADSRRLARLLQRKLNALFGSRNRFVEAPLTVLAPVGAPAVLVELGFASNPSDAQKLLSPAFQEQIAAAVAATLEEFLS